MGQTEEATLFLRLLPESSSYFIISSTEGTGPPVNWVPSQLNPTFSFIKWRFQCMTPLSKPFTQQINELFYLNLIKQLPLKWSENLYNLLVSPDNQPIPEKEIQAVCSYISTLYKQYYGLYSAMHSHISTLLKRIGAKNLFQNLGLESIGMNNDMNGELLMYFKPEEIKSESFQNIWENYTIILDSKLSVLFQSLFVHAEPFPKSSRLFQQDNTLTLVNWILLKKKQFIDQIIDPCFNLVLEGNVESCNNYIGSFTEVKPLLVLSFYESLSNAPIVFEKILREGTNVPSNIPIFEDVLQRMQHDSILVSDLRAITGINLGFDNLSGASIPYHLNAIMGSMEPNQFLSIIRQKYFAFSDRDIENDLTFYAIFKTLQSTLSATETGNAPDISFIDLIPDEQRRSVAEDVFSIIFAVSENITVPIAISIIDFALAIDPSFEAASIARPRLEAALSLGLGFKDALKPLSSLVVELISRSEFETARRVSRNDRGLFNLATTAMCVSSLALHTKAPFEDLDDIQRAVTENFLSTGGGDPGDDGFGLTQKRAKEMEPLELIDMDSIKNVLLMVNDKNSGANLDRFPQLKIWTMFERLAGKFNIHGSSLSDIVVDVIESDDIDKWESFSKFAGQSAMEILLRSSTIIGDNLRKMISTSSPLTAFIVGGMNDLELIKNKDIIKRSKTPKSFKDWEAKSDIEFEKELSILIENSEKNDYNFDPEDFDDLYYQNSILYEKITQQRMSKWPLDKLALILPYCSYRSIGMLNSIGSQTVKMTIHTLLLQKDYYIAKCLADDFGVIEYANETAQIAANSPGFTKSDKEELKTFFHSVNIPVQQTDTKDDDLHIASAMFLQAAQLELEFSLYADAIISIIRKISQSEIVSEPVFNLCLAQVTKVVSSLSITDMESELAASKIVGKMMRLMGALKARVQSISSLPVLEASLVKLLIVEDILNSGLCTRFNMRYSLKDFNTAEFAQSMYSAAVRFDFPRLMADLKLAYNLGQTPQQYQRALCAFRLGCLEDGLEELKMSVVSAFNKRPQGLAAQLELSLAWPFPVDVQHATEHRIVPSMYRAATNAVHSQVGVILGSPQIQTLDRALRLIKATGPLVRFYAGCGNFEEAFSLLNESGPTVRSFIKYIMTPALSNSHWNVFWRKLMRRSDLTGLVDDACDFMRAKRMWATLFDIQRRRGIHDDAIEACVMRFAEADSWAVSRAAMNDLRTETTNAVTAHGDDGKYSLEDLFMLIHRIEVQRSIAEYFEGTGHPFDRELELVSSKAHMIKLGATLLLEFQTGFALEACEYDDTAIRQIAELAVDILAARGDTAVATFVHNTKDMSEQDARLFVPKVIAALKPRIPDERHFAAFINANVHGHELRARCFAEVGMFEQAKSSARGNKALINELNL